MRLFGLVNSAVQGSVSEGSAIAGGRGPRVGLGKRGMVGKCNMPPATAHERKRGGGRGKGELHWTH